MICEVCYCQDTICRAKITKLNKIIYICDECETVFEVVKEGEEYKGINGVFFEDYMNQLGVDPSWDELSEIDFFWENE